MCKQRGGQMMVFHGGRVQRGYGLGSFFQSLAQRALPFLQKGVQSLGREALKTGADITQDVLRGRNLQESAQSRLQRTAKNLKEQALNQIIPQSGGSSRKPLKRKASQDQLSTSLAVGRKRAKTTRQNQQRRGVVKKTRVPHLNDIWS